MRFDWLVMTILSVAALVFVEIIVAAYVLWKLI
jgi:hypothetical protein